MPRVLFITFLCGLLSQGAQPLYTIDTFAGSNWTGDGKAATAALLLQPQGLVVDPQGTMYVSDAGDHRVRKFTPGGIIQTVAGTGTPGNLGDDGPAQKAQLSSPYGMTIDSAGFLYIADLGNGLIRRVGTDGQITTVAGGGTDTPAPDTAIPARKARLIQPRDVTVDRTGNLYIADFGAHFVYQVGRDGMLTVIAGTGQSGSITGPTKGSQAALSYPAALALDPMSGSLMIADSGNHRIRRLTLGSMSTLLDKAGKEIELGTPTGLTFDGFGKLYIADGSSRTTVVTSVGELSSLGAGGTSVAVNAGLELFVTADRQVKRLALSKVDVIAGLTGTGGAGDGTNPSEWRFSAPTALMRDLAGYLWIADTGNGRIRRLSPAGELTTFTNQIQAPISLAADSKGRIYVGDKSTGSIYRLDSATSPKLIFRNDSRPIVPAGLAFDASDNLFIADSANDLIRRLSVDGLVTTVAGGGRQVDDGQALLVKLSKPCSVAFDADGVLWFSEAGAGKIRKIASGNLTTLTGTDLKEPHGIHFDSNGRIWVADAGAHRAFAIERSGDWMPVGGTGDKGLSGDGDLALAAMLNGPSDILPQADGTVLVADTGNNRIRRLKPDATQSVAPPPVSVPAPTLSFAHAGTAAGDSFAPGQLIYIKGQGLLSATVSFGSTPATVTATDANRLTVQVPTSVQPGSADVTVQLLSGVKAKGTVKVVPSAPGIFTADSATGQALALNQDGSLNGINTPAARGTAVSLFVTGEGSATKATAEVGSYPAEVVWFGPAPGLTGIAQVNILTPGGFAPSGIVPVTLTLGGVRTQAGVTIVSR